MMKTSTALYQIEQQVSQLSLLDLLELIEVVTRRIRAKTLDQQGLWESDLAAMAADPEIRLELHKINEEFAVTEMDGLEFS